MSNLIINNNFLYALVISVLLSQPGWWYIESLEIDYISYCNLNAVVDIKLVQIFVMSPT